MRTVEDNLSDLLEKVEQLATELEYSLERVWIPVTERLPEKTGWYLCTLSGHLAQTIVDMCRFETVDGGFWSGCIEYNVVAWMELPKPYKEGSEEDGTD